MKRRSTKLERKCFNYQNNPNSKILNVLWEIFSINTVLKSIVFESTAQNYEFFKQFALLAVRDGIASVSVAVSHFMFFNENAFIHLILASGYQFQNLRHLSIFLLEFI